MSQALSAPLARLLVISTAVTVAVTACGGGSSSTSGDPGGTGTEPAAIAACDPGERPAVDGTCAAVGPASVPAGFVADGAWGFRPVLPAAHPCSGATRAVLGQETCQSVGASCTAAFPPAAATLAVRADGTAYPGRTDVQVFTTLADALAAAPAGATVAIDAGEFALPSAFARGVKLVGRCAEQTSLRGADFGVHVSSTITVGLSSLAVTGSPKVAFLVDHHGEVDLDGVWVHGDNDGAEVGNGATLAVKNSVLDGPATSVNTAAATNGAQAIFGGKLTVDASEIRGYQLAVAAQSVGTTVSITNTVLDGERQLAAENEALAQVGAFLGAHVTIDHSYVEAVPGRIAMVGAARLDGATDPTSPGNPPAALAITASALVHTTKPRETGSAIDVVGGASLTLDGVTLKHDCYAGIGASDASKIGLANSVVVTDAGPANARIALSGLSHAAFTLDHSAIVGAVQSAIVLDGGATATIGGSLVTGTKEVGVDDVTKFLGAGQAVAVSPDGALTAKDSAFVANEGTAVFLQSGSAEIDSTVFASTTASDPTTGGGWVSAVTGVDASLAVRSSAFVKNGRALALQGGRALLRDSSVTDHTEAFRLDGLSLQQTSDPVDEAVDAELVASKTTLLRNAVLVKSEPLTAP